MMHTWKTGLKKHTLHAHTPKSFTKHVNCQYGTDFFLGKCLLEITHGDGNYIDPLRLLFYQGDKFSVKKFESLSHLNDSSAKTVQMFT